MRSTAAPSESSTVATMQMDLAFAEPAVERAFRAHMAACNRHTALLSEIARLIAWAIITLRLATANDRLGALLACAGAASSIGLVAWRANRPYLQVTVCVAINCGQGLLQEFAVGRLWDAPDGNPTAGTCLRSLARTQFTNGIAWMVGMRLFLLPFRWAFPQLAALSVFYLHRTPRMCANPALYRACGLTGTTCAAAHTATVLSCLALLGAAIHRQELAARLAWVAPRTRRQLQAQLAAQPLAFWLNFALPSVCALLTYNYPWLY
ncbi:hypothetical protein COHA_000296 [Chlorella ohadii]|uniref:Uncharacterized protein n=1 Tax=Chlorella ohadii TaxID=2649997 RepID=A0AAD5E0V5_9CHLO|nr:hypothetical protein COHA_000296 [Chlorella ohadii]